MLHCFNFRGWNETMLFHKEECKLQRTHRAPHYRTSCTPTWGLCFYIYIYIDSSISHAMKQCCFIKRSANCKNSYKAPHCWTSCTPTWGLYFYIYIYIYIDYSISHALCTRINTFASRVSPLQCKPGSSGPMASYNWWPMHSIYWDS